MVVSPKDGMIPMAYKLNFKCTNNMDEYVKALVLGLKETINLGIDKRKVYGDSQIIIN